MAHGTRPADERVRYHDRMTRRRMAPALTALGAAACGTAAAQPHPIAVDIAPCVEIVALRELQPGRFEIELANGQLWRQTSSDRYRLQAGQPVRVYRARAGSRFFRLTVPALRGFVQVERIR
jgi:hypothetical protein